MLYIRVCSLELKELEPLMPPILRFSKPQHLQVEVNTASSTESVSAACLLAGPRIVSAAANLSGTEEQNDDEVVRRARLRTESRTRRRSNKER